MEKAYSVSSFALNVDREADTFGDIQVIYFSYTVPKRGSGAALPILQQCLVRNLRHMGGNMSILIKGF